MESKRKISKRTKSLVALGIILVASSILIALFVHAPVPKVTEVHRFAQAKPPGDITTGLSGGTSTTPTCAYATAPALSDTLVVAFYVSPSSITVAAPTDTLSNTFVRVAVKSGGSTVTFANYVYEANQSHTSGADTITLHFTGTVVDSYLTCWKDNGIWAKSTTNQSSSGTYTSGTSTTLSTVSLTPVVGDLVYVFGAYQPCGASGTPGYTSGFTAMSARGTDFTGATTCATSGTVKYHVNAMDEYIIPSATTGLTSSITSGTWASTVTTGTWGWSEVSVDFKQNDLTYSPNFAYSVTEAPKVSIGYTANLAYSVTSYINTLGMLYTPNLLYSVAEKAVIGLPYSPNFSWASTYASYFGTLYSPNFAYSVSTYAVNIGALESPNWLWSSAYVVFPYLFAYSENWGYSVAQALGLGSLFSSNWGFASTYAQDLQALYSPNFAYSVSNTLTASLAETSNWLYSATEALGAFIPYSSSWLWSTTDTSVLGLLFSSNWNWASSYVQNLELFYNSNWLWSSTSVSILGLLLSPSWNWASSYTQILATFYNSDWLWSDPNWFFFQVYNTVTNIIQNTCSDCGAFIQTTATTSITSAIAQATKSLGSNKNESLLFPFAMLTVIFTMLVTLIKLKPSKKSKRKRKHR